MVSYTRLVSLAFEVAPASADAPAVMSRVAELWNRNKEELKAATVAETREWLKKKL